MNLKARLVGLAVAYDNKGVLVLVPTFDFAGMTTEEATNIVNSIDEQGVITLSYGGEE